MEPKRYQCVKTVSATPMNEHDFLLEVPASNNFVSRFITGNRNGYRKGYKVESDDGRTWFVEKQEFERDYKEIDNNG